MAVLSPAAAPSVRTDLDLIQGSWASVAGPKEARFLIAGNRFAFEFLGGDVYIGTFKLDRGDMDLHTEAGPEKHVGTVTKCIYQLQGGVLRWCPGKPGSDRRPLSFPDVDDAKYLSLVFRRSPRR
jgi:uncharacterized protein (TIGR03067 family)